MDDRQMLSVGVSVRMTNQDGDADHLLPTERAYSVCRIDTYVPTSHEDCATKVVEVDRLDAFDPPVQAGVIWVAYDADGNGTLLRAHDTEQATTVRALGEE